MEFYSSSHSRATWAGSYHTLAPLPPLVPLHSCCVVVSIVCLKFFFRLLENFKCSKWFQNQYKTPLHLPQVFDHILRALLLLLGFFCTIHIFTVVAVFMALAVFVRAIVRTKQCIDDASENDLQLG